MNFNIEAYLNSLDINVDVIDLSGKGLTNLPDLSHFLNCKELDCCDNELTSLPALPPNLTYLDCENNKLTFLPALPDSLEELNCEDNQLASLPTLPDSLNDLFCRNNQLSLPTLPKTIEYLSISDNPIYSIKQYDNSQINDVKLKIQKINNFRNLYYTLKFRSQFRRLLWEKVRMPKIEAHYHPDNLIQRLLEEDGDLDKALENW